MTLAFTSVALRNFGPYRGEVRLDLTTTADAPVVVIHGENTLGKTSLFRALRWCLYGSPEMGHTPADANRDLNRYLNRMAYAEGDASMEVSMTFSSNGHRYQLVRRASFGAQVPRVSADLRIDAQAIQQSSIEEEIGRVLHPQISEFFLFDGELLRDFFDRLNTDRERDLLRGSIENVLGIPALQLAQRDVSVLTEDVMQQQAKALKSKQDAESAKRQLLELKSKQESLDTDRADLTRALSKARTDLDDVNARIANVDELKADAREMEGLETSIAADERTIRGLTAEMASLISRGWLAPLASRLELARVAVVKANDGSEANAKALVDARSRVSALESLMAGGLCPTCHQTLPVAGPDVERDLSEAQQDLAVMQDRTVTEPNYTLERIITALIDNTTGTLYSDKQRQLDRLDATQFDRGRRLATIKDRLKDNDAAQIRQLGARQDALEATIRSYEKKILDLKPEQDKIHAQQDKIAGILRRLGGSTPAVTAEALFYEYVRSALTMTIDRYKERTRSSVEQGASEMLRKLIRDEESYSGVRIGRDYRVDLLGSHGDAMRTSEGGKQLIALSLIGALKQAAVRGGPVVLDSPLARLDLTHRENVLQKWVPALGDQAVLLVQSGELTETQASDIMGSRIGHQYRIYRPSGRPDEAAIERV